jgi:hypothetical protein
MKPIILDTTTKKLQMVMSGAAATTNPSYIVSYADVTTSFTEGNLNGALNGATAVDIVPAPAASTRRTVTEIIIKNVDTAAVTIYFRLDDNGTTRNIKTISLAVGETWEMSTQTAIDGASGAAGADGNQYPAGVRCSVSSGIPNPTSDVTAATSVYVMEYVGGNFPLWNGSAFVSTALGGEKTAALSATYQTATNIYDVYLFNDGGTLRAGFGVAWTSATSRGTGAGTAELETVNGVDVNKNSMTVRSGSSSYTVAARYGTLVGTIAPSTSGQVQWTKLRRELANRYNRMDVGLYTCPGYSNGASASSYTIAASPSQYYEVNGGIDSRVYFPLCVPTHVKAVAQCLCTPASGGYGIVAVGIDTITNPTCNAWSAQSTTSQMTCNDDNEGLPMSIGNHYVSLLGAASAAGNATFYADQFRFGASADSKNTFLKVYVEL